MRLPPPRIGRRYRRLAGAQLRRTSSGVMEIAAGDDVALARGLGFAHAYDRLVQMELVRLAARGRLAECLRGDDEMVEVDLFMRQMGFTRGIEAEIASLSAGTLELARAYADGVNDYLDRYLVPAELLLVSHRPEPWSVADTLLTAIVMSYIGLAQSQQDMEKLIVQAIHGGVDVARLKGLFAPHLDGLDEETIAAVRQVHLRQPTIPAEVRFLSMLPKVMASNNWAIAASHSASGNALQCNDPHLEANRLPAVWYEWVGHAGDDYRVGISMPGVPGLIMGRTSRLSFGFTYGFMDLVDYFVEEVVDGSCRRGDELEPLVEREEVVLRKGGRAVRCRVFESAHGVLEVDGSQPLADGYYLARAWAGQLGGTSRSLEALLALSTAADVVEGQHAARHVAISCNWLLADRSGRIAYQQSGHLPKRQHSGLHPVLGRDRKNDWDGLVPAADLSSILDPPEGFLVTANQDLDQPGCPKAINLPMGSYRADRIADLISAADELDLATMKRIQRDLYSRQAEHFMELFKPLLPDTPAANTLRAWNLRYDAQSRGAVLFERVYAALLREVFGAGVFGLEAWDAVAASTAIVIDFYDFFDRALLGDDASWYREEGRDALLRRVLAQELARSAETSWGELRQVMMTNLFFGGKLPAWLGFDYGPITLEGGRATVVQGAIYRAHGRLTTFCPSYRYVTDMGRDEIETALAGGPSGRRTSPWYTSDVERWQRYRYKTLRP